MLVVFCKSALEAYRCGKILRYGVGDDDGEGERSELRRRLKTCCVNGNEEVGNFLSALL